MKKLLMTTLTALFLSVASFQASADFELDATLHLSNTCLLPFDEARSYFQEHRAEFLRASKMDNIDLSNLCPAHSPAALIAQIQELQVALERNRQYSEDMIRVLNNRISELEQQ